MERALEDELERELALRQRIFDHLAQEVAEKGSLTRAELSAFDVDGSAVRLIDANRGIWNPRRLLATLSIMSRPDSPYADMAVDDALFSYDYRAGSTDGDNTKLRRAHEYRLPIILLRWIRIGREIRYVPVFPVYVAVDDPINRRVFLALDPTLLDVADPRHLNPIERRYVHSTQKRRLHQPEFRSRVLLAYRTRCAVCRVGHAQLLDAAHIIGDAELDGHPDVDNALAMCKIHHAAYDANLIGISPDSRIHIGEQLMRDVSDSPTLRFAFHRLDGSELCPPTTRGDRPAKDRLDERFRDFLSVQRSSPRHPRRTDISWQSSRISTALSETTASEPTARPTSVTPADT